MLRYYFAMPTKNLNTICRWCDKSAAQTVHMLFGLQILVRTVHAYWVQFIHSDSVYTGECGKVLQFKIFISVHSILNNVWESLWDRNFYFEKRDWSFLTIRSFWITVYYSVGMYHSAYILSTNLVSVVLP